MGDIEKRLAIKNEAKQRVKSLKFGDPITNICAGEKNPLRLCYFVRYKASSGVVQCTDKKGKFWDVYVKFIYGGHLSTEESRELFKPVWESEYA